MRGKLFLTLLAIALATAGSVYGWRWFGPLDVAVTNPARGPAVVAIYASGTVEPTVMMPIAPKVTGRLEKLLVDEGTEVKEGQLLARLNDRELAAAVAEWEARVRFAEAQYKRATELFERGVSTGESRDRARNEFDTARAGLTRSRELSEQMKLVAPANGTIIRRDGEVGQLIQTGQTLFWMSCCAPLRVSAEVDEEDIPLVRPGLKVLIRADAFPDRVLDGRVTQITPKGDPVARSFRVRIELPTDTPLLIGMTADCNILADERPDALLLPIGAVRDGKVWLVRDGMLEERAVTTGVSGNGRIEIRSGLTEGDQVALDADDRFRAGRRVAIRSGS